MKRRARREAENFRREVEEGFHTAPMDPGLPIKPKRAPKLEPMTDAQARYIGSVTVNDITFATGPAGTGKTFIAGSMAADLLRTKMIEKVFITRPAVEAGENLGFLPGELDEKFAPFARPFIEVMIERLGQGFVDCAIKNKKIECLPLAYMRGWTFKHALVILDEAQNTTPTQMKMFLTRLGEGGRMIIDGDISQKDIPGPSGLADAVKKTRGLRGVGHVHFTRDDIVRHGLVQEIVEAYELPAEEVEDDDRAGLNKVLARG